MPALHHCTPFRRLLAKAFRREPYSLGRFKLINRDEAAGLLQVMKFPQSRQVDDKQAVLRGKAAQGAVTGKMSLLGNSVILQTKRTGLRSLGVLSMDH